MYNERENISILHSEITLAVKQSKKEKLITDYEIVFVNDGSRDRSLDVFKELSKKDSKLKVINLRKNFGQTPALKAGFDNSKGDLLLTMDGDLQSDPKDIPRIMTVSPGKRFCSRALSKRIMTTGRRT